MRRMYALILAGALLLLAACAPVQPVAVPAAPVQPPAREEPSSRAEPSPAAAKPEEPPAPELLVYAPGKKMTPEETVAAYFEAQYQGYAALAYMDVTGLLDMEQQQNRNMAAWSETLALRRRLLAEEALCYVETRRFPYTIKFEAQPEDDRMEFWSRRGGQDSGVLILHFRIAGEPGRAYPPIMAMNAQHSIFLKQVDGVWKITRHYFPGSVRSFMRSGVLTVPTEKEMREQLRQEFAAVSQPAAGAAPSGAAAYSADEAVAYALRYTETPNPAFYHIGDWMGNCANFVSQCVSAGFGGRMSARWYGGDGGSPPWENVNHFWTDIIEPQGLGGVAVEGVSAVRTGDVIQTRVRGSEDAERFTHMLLVTEAETLLLSQNSPAAFVYYSDLVNVETRIVRPAWLAV